MNVKLNPKPALVPLNSKLKQNSSNNTSLQNKQPVRVTQSNSTSTTFREPFFCLQKPGHWIGLETERSSREAFYFSSCHWKRVVPNSVPSDTTGSFCNCTCIHQEKQKSCESVMLNILIWDTQCPSWSGKPRLQNLTLSSKLELALLRSLSVLKLHRTPQELWAAVNEGTACIPQRTCLLHWPSNFFQKYTAALGTYCPALPALWQAMPAGTQRDEDANPAQHSSNIILLTSPLPEKMHVQTSSLKGMVTC